MYFDNMGGNNIFVDLKLFSKILINPTTNSKGLLEVDTFGNSLISDIDGGSTPLGVLSTYKGGNIIFQNQTSKGFVMVKEGETIDLECDYIKGTKYYLEATVLHSSDKTNNTFKITLGDRKVFKVFSNGTEITKYTVGKDSITINNYPSNMLKLFDNISVYTYRTPSMSDVNVEITYMQYKQLDVYGNSNEQDFAPYLYKGNLLELQAIEGFSYNKNTETSTIENPFKGATKYIINKTNSSVSISTYISDVEPILSKYVGSNPFRIILCNPQIGRFFIINGCIINGSETIALNKQLSVISLNIPCSNYIDIQLMGDIPYGLDKFGSGFFGKGLNIRNSNRG